MWTALYPTMTLPPVPPVPSLGTSQDQLCAEDWSLFVRLDWCERTIRRLEQRGPDNNVVSIRGELLFHSKPGNFHQRDLPFDCGLTQVFAPAFRHFSAEASWPCCRKIGSALILFDLIDFLMGLPGKASAARALNYFMRKLYASPIFIEGDLARCIIDAGKHFLKAYSRLSLLCWQLKVAKYPTMPKSHMLHHVVIQMHEQLSQFRFLENPISMSTSSDEDFIGKVCELTRKVSPRQRIRRCYERYLTQVLLLWHRGRWQLGTWQRLGKGDGVLFMQCVKLCKMLHFRVCPRNCRSNPFIAVQTWN